MYYIYLDTYHEQDLIKKILLDKNGWASKFNIYFTKNKKEANVIIYFYSNDNIKKKIGKYFSGFSVCDRGKSPHEIFINKNRWYSTPHNFKIHKSMILNNDKKKTEQLYYRQYVLQHELGHSIDLADHEIYDTTNNKTFCPVMFQQTRGNIMNNKVLYVPNPWITLEKKKFNNYYLKKFLNSQKKYIQYL